MEKPQIGLLHVETLDSTMFDEFRDEVEHENLELEIKGVPKPGPFASVEWFIPTTIFTFIGKAYFEVVPQRDGQRPLQGS